jgi:HEAT repeat protein
MDFSSVSSVDDDCEEAGTMRTISFVLVLAVGVSVRAAEPDSVLADELTLKAAGLGIDGPGLIAFFRLRSQAQAGPERLQALIGQLADPSPRKGAEAAAELVGIGPAAVPWLRQAVKDPDAAIVTERARRCLQALEGSGSGAIPAAAARLLAVRRPDEAAAILLAYLPAADNESVVEDVKAALSLVAYREDSPEPALVRALQDDLALRRSVAADVLGEAGMAEPRAALRRLLTDPTPLVRMRAALALANVREAEAVGTLVALLGELPPSQGKQVEEYLAALAGEQAPKVALGTTADERTKCQAAWAAWWKTSEGSALVGEVRKRTLRDTDRGKVQALVRQLGAETFDLREKAQRELLAMGTAVIPVLRLALQDPDVEISTRARLLLERIEKTPTAPLSPVVVRLIGYRKPAGAVEALLAFLPFGEDEGTLGEVQDALAALAFPDDRPDPALVAALASPTPALRAVAAEALCQPGHPEQRAAVRKLLADPDGTVRLKAALALAAVRDREAVPVLIALLGEMSRSQSALAEEYLQQLAGDRAPAEVAGDDPANRQKRRDAWAAWWKEQGSGVRLALGSRAGARPYFYGYTLIALPQNGSVMELASDGKQRWQVTGLSNPMDFQVLPGHRLLVAEYSANQVTERTLKGEIVWKKEVSWPTGCERLPNGHTFIVSRNVLMEVDRSGKEVFAIQRNRHDIMSARKLRDGQIVMVTNSGCVRLDASGKELRSFPLPNGVGSSYVEILPRGNVLIPVPWMNKLTEYDAEGKVVWEGDAPQPMGGFRLPNGNTLIPTQMWPAKVVEIDKAGKTVWEYPTPTYPGRVKRR